MSGYLARNPLMTDEPQFGPPPVVAGRPVLPNPLAMPAGDWRDTVAPQPTQADAADATAKAYTEWLARDRAEQVRLGHVDPATGQLTPAGWKAQAGVIGGGFGPADVGLAGGALGLIKNYHGSPHLFPPTPKNPLGEFDITKIGTGEGAQAYGKGAGYTADVEGLARGYRDRLTLPTDHPDLVAARDAYNAAYNLPMGGTDAEFNAALAKRDEAFAALQAAKELPKVKSQGHMYEVNIHAEPEDFLHWDKPFSEQSPKVQEQIRSIVPPVPDGVTRLNTGRWVTTSGGQPVGWPDGWPDMSTAQYALKVMREDTPVQNMTGAQIHGYLAKSGPHGGSNDAAAAEALRNAGIPGIRYLDEPSRSKGPYHPDATHNHVVFDANTAEIIRRYGIAGLIGGGAAATAAGGNQGQNQ